MIKDIMLMTVVAIIVMKLGHIFTIKFVIKPIKRFFIKLKKDWDDA